MQAKVLQVGQPMERTHYIHYLVDTSYGIGDEPTRFWVGEEFVAGVFSKEVAA